MKITLISIYPDISSFGVRTVSAVLKREGHDVDMIFLTKEFWERFSEKTLKDLVDLTKDSNLIGISLMTNFWDNAVQLSTRLKQHYDTPILWGGTHPTVRPDECLEHADIVCISESEAPLVELTRKMSKGENYLDIKGMAFKTKEKRINNGHAALPGSKASMFQHLDEIPNQDYEWSTHYILRGEDIVKMDMAALNEQNKTYMTLPTRGCPFACTFCVNSEFLKMYPHQKPIRMRSVDHIIKELEDVRDNMPFVKNILFNDDAFFLMPLEQIKEFSKKYKQKIKMPLIITGATPSTLSKTKLAVLVEAGLIEMRMGIQTLAEKTKRLYKRPHSNKQIYEAVKIINNHKDKVKVRYDIILESPWDTEDNTIETLRFLAKMPAPYNLNLFSLVFFPGTDLYTKAKKEGIIRNDLEDVYRKHYGDESLKRSFLTSLFYLLHDYGSVGANIPEWVMKFLTNKKRWQIPIHKLVVLFLKVIHKFLRRKHRLKLRLSRMKHKLYISGSLKKYGFESG